jgi:hypothetical protein
MGMGSWDNNPIGGGEGRGEGAPTKPSPKLLSNFSDQKMPLYIWRGATMSKQTTNKPAKRSQVLHDHKENAFFLLLKNLLVLLMKEASIHKRVQVQN